MSMLNEKNYIQSLPEFFAALSGRVLELTPIISQQWFAYLDNHLTAVRSSEFQKECQDRIDLYNGRYQHIIQEILEDNVDNINEWAPHIQAHNITRLLVNSLSVIYKNGAERSIEEGNDRDSEIWGQIVKHSNYEQVLQTVNKMVNLVQTVLVRVYYNQRSHSIMLDILTPERCSVIEDTYDYSKALAVCYETKPSTSYLKKVGDNQNIKYFWTDNHFKKFTVRNGHLYFIQPETNYDGINPYGLLPFVKFVQETEMEGYFIDGGYDITSAHIDIAYKLTLLNMIAKFQTFSVPVLTGNVAGGKGSHASQNLVIHPGRPITLELNQADEQPASLNFVTPSANIQGLLDLVNADITRIASVYGMSPSDFIVSGDAQSGFSMQIQNRRHTDIIKTHKPFYEKAEERLFEVIKKVWNTHIVVDKENELYGETFSDSCKLFVSVKEPEMIIDPAEKRDSITFALQNKLITRKRAIMDYYGLTEEEAEERLKEVEESKEEEPEPEIFQAPETETFEEPAIAQEEEIE